jgi:SOS-response transcriptional repressor LexA
MTKQSNPYQAAGEDVASTLWDLRLADEGELDQAPLELYCRAKELCSERCFDNAITCCETARRLARQTRDSRNIAAFRYTEGFSLALLGAIYLHCRKVHTAIECLQQAADQFRDSNRLRSESVAWMAMGEGYVLLIGENRKKGNIPLQDWERALSAFQRCLNTIESLRATDQATVKLQERVVKRLEEVNQRFTESMGGNTAPSPGDPATNPTGEVYPIPVVESIAAGVGIIADNDIRGQIWLSREQVRDAKFAIRVEGQSMKGDSILDGDYVIIQEQPVVERRGAVAAVLILTEGQTLGTLKHYYQENDHHRLEPANEGEPTLIVVPIEQHVERIERYYRQHGQNVVVYPGDCQIAGKPVALFREMT